MLTLVATPIGNLADFSERGRAALAEADLILCEDTRHSLKLLKHNSIHRPLKSYHKFNEAKREEELLDLLREGKQIALISDAGTPGISDPGERIVRACIKADLPVSAIPGPCALILALILSGFPTLPFQFVGFLAKKPAAQLRSMAQFQGTSIAYESPHRIAKTLALLEPDQPVAIARELTKRYEEVLRGTAEELLPRCEGLKGELVLLLGPRPKPEPGGATRTAREAIERLRASDDPAELSKKILSEMPEMASLHHVCQAAQEGRLDEIEEEMRQALRDVVERAEAFDGATILTISQSGTVSRAIGAQKGVRAIAAEGRPGFEGRRLAADLAKRGVPVTLVSDAALYGMLEKADLVWVGADAVGDDFFVNKVGTYALCLAARKAGVPVHLLADRFKRFPDGVELKIASRDEAEIWSDPPEGVALLNPYFEKIPLELASKILL